MVSPELLKMWRWKAALVAESFLDCDLRLPLGHSLLNNVAHVLAKQVTELVGVVQSGSPQCILQEGVHVVVQLGHHQLDVTALHCKHKWCDATLSHGVDIHGLLLNEHLISPNVAHTTSKVDGRATRPVLRV